MFEAFTRRWTWVHSKLALAAFAIFLAASPVPAPIAPVAPLPQPAPATFDEGAPARLIKAAVPEPNTGLVVNGVLALDRPLEPAEYAWNEAGAPAGRTVIVVDLGAQLLYVYRSGVEIGRSTLIQGDDETPTPLGTFPILEKDADHVSNLYDALMPFMLRLTWAGVAIHGSVVGEGNVTHGCIGIPEEFAQLLFAKAKVGDRVLVTKSWTPTPARAATA